MIILIDTLFIFITNIVIFKKITNLQDNIIKNKIILFICIFAINILLHIIKALKYTCSRKLHETIYRSVFISCIAIIGYSLYTDLIYYDILSSYNILIASLIISLFVFFGKVLEIILLPKILRCYVNKINNRERAKSMDLDK